LAPWKLVATAIPSLRATVHQHPTSPLPSHLNPLTSVLQLPGLVERSLVASQTLQTLVVQPSDRLGEESTGRGDASSVVCGQSGEESVGESREDLEVSSLDDRVEVGALSLLVLCGSDVVGDSVALANVSAGQLDSETVVVVSELAELVRAHVDAAGSAPEFQLVFCGAIVAAKGDDLRVLRAKPRFDGTWKGLCRSL
jgi:hypothetical protein